MKIQNPAGNKKTDPGENTQDPSFFDLITVIAHELKAEAFF